MAIFISSCTNEPKQSPEIKIAKTVPANYVSATDSSFYIHNDTVYFNKQFFTGFRYSLYKNGDTEFVHSYFNGVEEGQQRDWYDNKQPAEELFYINGKKEGFQQGWWPDGKKRFIYTTISDRFEGEVKEWDSKGMMYRFFHYKNGNEEGSEKLWWDNGTVRANYVIRNGKKYGLIGLKLCANPYDSINKK